jgi:hypothetical protein
MNKNAQQAGEPRLFDDPLQSTWSYRPVRKGAKTCGRDPQAGPGTCRLWWEGCPKAEQRNCYLHWWQQQNRQPS